METREQDEIFVKPCLNQSISEDPIRERVRFFECISISVLPQGIFKFLQARKVHGQNIQRMSLIIGCSAQVAQPGSFETSANI